MHTITILSPRRAFARLIAATVLWSTMPVLAACDDGSPVATAPNVSSVETIAQVSARLMALEREKNAIAFGAHPRTPAQVARFLSMFAPEFWSINLGPTGVTQNGYAELPAGVTSFPTMPFTISDMRAVATNAESIVISYQVALDTPMGRVTYLASTVWARSAHGEWQSIFYQATPI